MITKDSESWDDIAVAAHVPCNLDGVLCGYHLAQIRPDPAKMEGRYLARAFSASGILDQFRVAATGITRYGLSKYAIDSSTFPVPPSPEQRAIAAFLDRETGKTDALVAKQERLVELLREKRSTLITQAVTRGLDPNAPMRDSGVEWLGDIPAHWEVTPVYARYEVALGKMLDAKRISGDYLGPYLRNVDVQWDRIDVGDLPEMDFAPGERDRYALRPGDLLVCEGGEVGRTAVWRGELPECFYPKAIHRVRALRDSDVPRYLYHVMHSMAKTGVFVAGGKPEHNRSSHSRTASTL